MAQAVGAYKERERKQKLAKELAVAEQTRQVAANVEAMQP